MPRELSKLNTLSIRDTKHLCHLLSTNRTELLSIISGLKSHCEDYYIFRTEVRNGKERHYATPRGRFREIINRLSTLLSRLHIPDNMHGGVRYRSTITYASPHVRRPVLLKSDIKDFFPAVRPKKVYNLFLRELDCSPDVAHILTRLTTVNNQLPQGSPTSTIIANLLSKGIARRLHLLTKSINGVAGTYVDDIALSGPAYIGRFKRLVTKVISQEGFVPNEAKTKAYKHNEDHVTVGLRVNDRLDISSGKLKEIREFVEAIAVMKTMGEPIAESTISSAVGRIRYVRNFNRGAAKSLAKRLRLALRSGTAV